MRKNRLIALIGTLTMAAAGLAAVSAGVSSKKADSVSAWTSDSVYLAGSFNSWSTTADKLDVVNSNEAEVTNFFDYDEGEKTFKLVVNDKWLSMNNMGWGKDNTGEVSKIYEGNGDMKLWTNVGSSGSRVAATFHFWCSYDNAQAMKVDLVQAYKVTFNSNGGSAVSSIENKSGSSIAEPTNPTKSDATFGGWYTDSGLNTPASWPLTLDSNKTLYAKWLADSYTVAFAKGDSGASGEMAPQAVEVGQTINAPSCGFTAPAGKKFVNWSGSNGGTYDVGDEIPSQQKDQTITLTANWANFDPADGHYIEGLIDGTTNSRFEMTYNGGSNQYSITQHFAAGDSFKIYQYQSEAGTCVCGGEQLESGSGSAKDANQFANGTDNAISVLVPGTYTMYYKPGAQHGEKLWVGSITYTVTYYPNNGTEETAVTDTVNVGDTTYTARSASPFTKPSGKKLVSWNTVADGSGDRYDLGSSFKDADQTSTYSLYAQWDWNNPRDGYYAEGTISGQSGRVPMEYDSEKHEHYVSVSLGADDTFKFVSYTDETPTWFGGNLYKTSGDTETALHAGQLEINGSDDFKILVPGTYKGYLADTADSQGKKIWIGAIKFGVQYLAGAGTGSRPEDSYNCYVDLTKAPTAIENPFTAPDHSTFTGWLGSDGHTYAVGDAIPSQTQETTLTLTAQYSTAQTYDIILNDNGGEGGEGLIEDVEVGDLISVETIPTKEHYNFDGYFTAASGGVKVIDSDGSNENPYQADYGTELFAQWSQYTITINNSDERGGTAYLHGAANEVLTLNSITDIFGPTFEEPLGRYYVGLKTDKTSSETAVKEITITGNATYDACYAFYDASYYTYKINNGSLVSFTNHRDSDPSKSETYLQVYYSTIDVVRDQQFTQFQYNGSDITVSFDESTNLTPDGKVKMDATDALLELRLIYNSTTEEYSYELALGGLPHDNQHYVSVNGILYSTTGQQQSGSDLWEWKAEKVSVGPGQKVDPYYNGYYSFTRFDGDANFFELVDGKANCIATQTLTYNIYIKETKTGTADAVYIGLTPESEALLFAQKFLEEVSGECKIEKDAEGHDVVMTDIDKLTSAWFEMSEEYKSLSSAAKENLKTAKADPESELDLEKFASSYDYIYWKYGNTLKDYGGNFADRNVKVQLGSRQFSVSNVSTSTWIIAAVAVVGIAAVGIFFIYRKRKEN